MKRIFTIVFTALSINAFAQIPTAGLVGHYPFTGNADDASTNANNGMVYGATLTNDRFGNTNSAYSFDGNSNYIEVSNSSSLQFALNTQTISFWMKIPSKPFPINEHAIFEKMDQNLATDPTGNSAQGFKISFAPSNDIYYSIKSGIGSNWASVTIPNNQFAANQYCNIVFTNDNDSLRSYLNGVKINSFKIPSGTVIGANTSPLLIGKELWTSNGANMDYFKGILDDIAIYERALTSTEISQLFSNGCSNPDVTSNIVSSFSFSGNANDASVNANNGIVYGATLTADRFGNANSAFSFDGVNNYIEIPNSSSLQFTSNLQTISFWMKIPSIPNPINEHALFEKMDQHLSADPSGNSAEGFKISFAPSGDIYYSIKSGSGSNWSSVILPNNLLTANQYYNIVFTNDNDSLRSFLNGVNINSVKTSAGTVIGANNSSLLIGKELWTSNGANMDYFNGILDDITIYERALSPCDIDSIYNMTNPITSGINEPGNASTNFVYPNPSSDKIFLNTILSVELSIYNYTGQIVKSIHCDSGQVDVSDLNNGIYFLKVKVRDSDKLSIYKFVKD